MTTTAIENPRAPTAARVHKSNDAHWYTQQGEPMYEVPSADGKRTVKTTIAHARKMNLLPSVTTIIGDVLAKPALTSWLCEQAALAVLTSPQRKGEQLDAFVKRVLQEERQQDSEARIAADLGTNVHGALENALKTKARAEKTIIHGSVKAYVDPVLALPLLQGRVVSTERTIAGQGYAGKYDAEIDNDQFLDMLDFKTAKTMPKAEYGSWDEHKLQLSAYAKARSLQGGLGDKRIRCWNIYISTTKPGEVVVFENMDWETTYEQGFKPLVQYWQWKKGYRP